MTAGAVQEGQLVDVAGRRVHVHDMGSGPAVVLLHGSGPGTTAAAAWGPVAAALSSRHRVIYPDLAGFGGSEAAAAADRDSPAGAAAPADRDSPAGAAAPADRDSPAGAAAPADRDSPAGAAAPSDRDGVSGRPYGRAAWTAQILGLLDVLGIERCAVVGNSAGGAIALSVAHARPELVTRVAAIGTLGLDMPLPPGLDALWAYEPSRENARALLELLNHDPSRITDEAVEARLRATLEPGPRAAFPQLFPPPRERWVRDLALREDELAAIAVPVLLVHGAQDRVVPLRDSTLPLLGLLRDVRAHVFGACGHASPVERPTELHRLLTTFLEDHD
jgi:2-hydroxymuconate-semialdehyde hydrolase